MISADDSDDERDDDHESESIVDPRPDPDDGPWYRNQLAGRWPRVPSLGGGHRLGARIGDAVAGAVAGVLVNLLLFVTRVIPGTWKMWRGFINAGYRGMTKSSSSIDVVGHILVGGQIKHVPLAWNHEKQRYETLTDDPDYWNRADGGQQLYRVAGSVPAVWAADASNELGSHIQAEVAEVLDLGNDQDLYHSASVQHTEVDVNGPIPESGFGPDAVADGGYETEQRTEHISITDPGSFVDQLVDIGHDADARVVSMEKYFETYPSRVAPEEMHLQEERGRLAERDPEEWKSFAVKMMLIAAAIVIGSLGMVFVVPPLLGSSISSVGSTIMPGMASLLGVM